MRDADIALRLADIRQRMARAAERAGRRAEDVRLVAVSKTFGAEEIAPVLEAGQRVFGENRVQEAMGKWPGLRERFSGVELHLIGPLQTNKVREAVAHFDVIETLDRESLAVALATERAKRGIDDIAVMRIEQLYPFPHEEFAAQIALYPHAKSVVWVQEEPGNQGAWHRIQHYLLEHLRPEHVLTAAQRKSSASPAVGYLQLHNQQQKEIIDAALTLDAAPSKKAAD